MTDDMTDDMEERLRALLRQRANVPSVSGDPVVAVQHRMRLRAVRRGVAAAATAAVCVAGIAIGATALAGNSATPLRIGPAIGPSSSSNPGPTLQPHTPQLSLPALPSAPAGSPVASAAVSPAPGTSTTPLPSNVSALVLPNGYSFGGLGVASGQLLVVGAALSTPATDAVPPPCASARITSNPFAVSTPATTIHLTEPGANSCPDPASVGERVAIDVMNPDGGSLAFTTSIAMTVTDPRTGTPKTGPVVMRISEASNTNPVVAYGGGSLWIYDVDTSNGPEAIQVSATSGQVEDVVRTPQLYRPIMAANSDGLWLGNSIEGSAVAGTVFHVAPASHVVTSVVPSPSDAVDWMVADNGHLWAGIRPAGGSLFSVWRFDGPNATVAFHTPEPSLEAGPNLVVGDEQDGLWFTTPDPPIGATPSPGDNQHLDVVRLGPDTGKPTIEAVLPPLDQLAAESQTAAGQAAFFADSYFLLQSPSVGGYTGFTQLLRVAPLS